MESSALDSSAIPATETLSATARRRLLSIRGEPLFVADWDGILMIHFAVDAGRLQRDVPFELDLWKGQAYMSLVAFTLRGLKPRFGGRVGELLLRPIATHHFLNVRTYVNQGDETGIHFLAEWLSNRLAVRLGPSTFSLPYRYGRIEYHHGRNARGELNLDGRVTDVRNGATLVYRARSQTEASCELEPCVTGSIDEWLMERYTAFNCLTGRRRFFRVWHEPWLQRRVEVQLLEDSLLRLNWPWFCEALMVGANFSPSAGEVWLGRPHRC